MTYISPLLQNKINHTSGYRTDGSVSVPSNELKKQHEKVYEDLKRRANEVKPNEAKAKVLKDGPIKGAIRGTKDTFKDGANFFEAVKTGQMSDNNLGRMNDLGLKLGSLLIASFLATHAKTKTQAIMNFIGGATFVSAMSLLPKIFINIPARIIHGFPIDQKYISAQGDKKDFFLDNQFIVWDAQPKEDMKKYAKRSGIDFEEENGEAKIQRKMQKTALQNRTLALALSGIGVPVSTALVGNAVEPIVKDAVAKHGLNKTKKIIQGDLDQYLNKAPQDVRNVKELNEFLKEYNGSKTLDNDFYQKLAKFFDITDVLEKFKDQDDFTPIKNYGSKGIIEELRNIQLSKSTVNIDSLKEALKTVEVADELSAFLPNGSLSKLSEEQIDSIVAQLKDDSSLLQLKKVLSEALPATQTHKVLSCVKTNNEDFFKIIKDYNAETMGTLRGRLKAYLDLINPVLGSTAESVYTKKFTDSMTETFNALGLNDSKQYQTLKQLKQGSSRYAEETISGIIQNKVKDIQPGSEDHLKLIESFNVSHGVTRQGFIKEKITGPLKDMLGNLFKKEDSMSLEKVISILSNKENIAKIHTNSDFEGLNNAIIGKEGEVGSISRLISNFINNKQIDIEAVQSKGVICANFEMRVLNGDLKERPKEWIEAARHIVYSGNPSVRNNNGFICNKEVYEDIINTVFDKDAFKTESGIIPNIQNIVQGLKEFKGNITEKNLKTGSFSKLVKDFATSMYNNKTWLKIVAPVAISLAAIALLIQPFFGNIKKEFPDENKNGGAK